MYLLILQYFLLYVFLLDLVFGGLEFGLFRGRFFIFLYFGQLVFWGLGMCCYVFLVKQFQVVYVDSEDIFFGFLVRVKRVVFGSAFFMEFLYIIFQCFFVVFYFVFSVDVSLFFFRYFFSCGRLGSSLLVRLLFVMCVQGSRCKEDSVEVLLQEVEFYNFQIIVVFLAGLLFREYRGLLVKCQGFEIVLRQRQVCVRWCLVRSFYKYFYFILLVVVGEVKSMYVMFGFIWFIRSLYEMQEERLVQEVVRGLDVGYFKLIFCSVGLVECVVMVFVLRYFRRFVVLQLDYNFVGDVGVEQLLFCFSVCIVFQ